MPIAGIVRCLKDRAGPLERQDDPQPFPGRASLTHYQPPGTPPEKPAFERPHLAHLHARIAGAPRRNPATIPGDLRNITSAKFSRSASPSRPGQQRSSDSFVRPPASNTCAGRGS